jgi:hypothetical protein
MQPIDWEGLERSYDEIISWLESLDLKKRDRIRIHRHNIAKMLDANNSGQLAEFQSGLTNEDRREHLWSISESMEFIDAVLPLRAIGAPGLDDVIRRAVDGPIDPSREHEKNSSGRNATFELVVGGLLAKGGLRPVFGEQPDVKAEFEDRLLLIQCKRALRQSSIASNIYSASKQLQGNLRTLVRDRPCGISAICLSRVINSGENLLEFPSVSRVTHDFQAVLDKHALPFEKRVCEAARYGISATWFYGGSPAAIPADRRVTFIQSATMVPATDARDHELLRRLCAIVKLR